MNVSYSLHLQLIMLINGKNRIASYFSKRIAKIKHTASKAEG